MPLAGVHCLQMLSVLRTVPSPLHGTSHSTRSNGPTPVVDTNRDRQAGELGRKGALWDLCDT